MLDQKKKKAGSLSAGAQVTLGLKVTKAKTLNCTQKPKGSQAAVEELPEHVLTTHALPVRSRRPKLGSTAQGLATLRPRTEVTEPQTAPGACHLLSAFSVS